VGSAIWGWDIFELFLLQNHPFRNLYTDPYTSCGMSGKLFFYIFNLFDFVVVDRLMARTRGVCSQGDRRERPTASVRRGDRRGVGKDVVPSAADVGAFPGEPIDGFQLLSYPDRVAYNLWQGEVNI